MNDIDIELAAQELAEAKYDFSEAFLLYRLKAKTDTQAEHQAYVHCGKRLTVAEARLAAELRK